MLWWTIIQYKQCNISKIYYKNTKNRFKICPCLFQVSVNVPGSSMHKDTLSLYLNCSDAASFPIVHGLCSAFHTTQQSVTNDRILLLKHEKVTSEDGVILNVQKITFMPGKVPLFALKLPPKRFFNLRGYVTFWICYQPSWSLGIITASWLSVNR